MYHCWKCGKPVKATKKNCNNRVKGFLKLKKCGVMTYSNKRQIAKNHSLVNEKESVFKRLFNF